MQNKVAEEMEKASLMQNEADEEKKTAIQEQERCTRLESQLRDELAQSCLMQNEAAKSKERARLMQNEAKEESDRFPGLQTNSFCTTTTSYSNNASIAHLLQAPTHTFVSQTQPPHRL